ncbi:alanine dehydrogenase [Nocardiopsis kunsanensis]|uniref:Alanine dehydrogenase n=1 Tax=Nocardiopsis kunsanensis TaxID=141693 RepID=A0A919CEU8_9ACTN|nr:alanine dehydrogenase [Nocardiopsis kunsanensis]GHD14210.1 alanine dehydrogenase [Nocardiopsis kunsanensis]
MRIGVPREIKNHEYRVAITPAGVHELVGRGHEIAIENGAGRGSSITDREYAEAGALLLDTADEVWGFGDLILKVKEPVPEEYHRMRRGQTLFAFLHLAADRECTEALLEHGVTGIAYETVQTSDGALPLLAPMSEVAGRLAAQVGSVSLQRPAGGRGVLMGGVPGVRPAKVTVIGAGVAGLNATQVAVGMGADVTVLELSARKLRHLDEVYRGQVRTVVSNSMELEQSALESDMVIGAVLVPGAKAPELISNELVSRMRPGAVLVDIAIDQGGCFEDSRPTTHDDPTFTVHDTVFYCVANMPGAVPNTSTHALTKDTLHYVVELADKGWRRALRDDPALAGGLNVHDGQVVYEPVAQAHGLKHCALEQVLAEA